MAKVKPLGRRYEISKHRFYELYHWCLQYKEWKDELKYATDTLKSPQITDMPHGSGTGDATSNLAMRRAKLSEQCEMIEETAKEADAELWEYILKGVTDETASYTYLRQIMNIPCGKNYYFEKRRKFYYLLSRKV
jgi:hypothetical protein